MERKTFGMRGAQLLTVGILAGLLVFVIARRQAQPSIAGSSSASPAPNPQETIYAMFNAAKAGDSGRYLAAYAGQMRSSLEESARETGQKIFSEYLKKSNRAVVGLIVSAPRQISEREVTVQIEYIYRDRRDVQVLSLEQETGEWKITRMEGTEAGQSLVPYGAEAK